MSELLDQFLLEGRELIQQATDDLLALERHPGDAARLDGAFRAVHTLKGSVALFDLVPMERALHAAEDLLDAVRDGRRAAGQNVMDALLDLIGASEGGSRRSRGRAACPRMRRSTGGRWRGATRGPGWRCGAVRDGAPGGTLGHEGRMVAGADGGRSGSSCGGAGKREGRDGAALRSGARLLLPRRRPDGARPCGAGTDRVARPAPRALAGGRARSLHLQSRHRVAEHGGGGGGPAGLPLSRGPSGCCSDPAAGSTRAGGAGTGRRDDERRVAQPTGGCGAGRRAGGSGR
ncbi:Hpt domain-containing protein [Siccirubricoccus sp. G192]|nr:Hpt domain-containing protein [Siccirubricoccus sp. G192]